MKIKPEVLVIVAALLTVGVYFIVKKSINNNKLVDKINPKGMSVAYIGDSQMANFGTTGWQNQMAKKYGLKAFLVKENDEVGASKTSNLAVVGKNTTWMKDKLLKFYKDWGYKPQVLFIYGGGNSITAGQTPADVIKDTQDMVNIAKQYGTPYVYVVSGFRSEKVSLPTKAITVADSTKRDAYKTQLPQQIKNATAVIPIWEQADQTYTSDGLHIHDTNKLKELADYVGSKIFKQ